MGKVMLATGLIVGYGYMMETFMAWYSGDPFEWYLIVNRVTGPYASLYFLLIICNIIIPQALWSSRVRSSPLALWLLALVINLGMWLERFVIIVVSLHRDFLPSSWDMYYPTIWDFMTFFGSIGLFLTLLLLFLRFLPLISIFEMRALVKETAKEAGR
jgi:molybdopterin-containing oxidoreductase family membrane subunit